MIEIVDALESSWFDIGGLQRNMPRAEERLKVYDLIGSRAQVFRTGHLNDEANAKECSLVIHEFLRHPRASLAVILCNLLPSNRAKTALSPISLATIRETPAETAHQRVAIAHLVAAHPKLDEESAVWVSSVLCGETEEGCQQVRSAMQAARASVKSVQALSKVALSFLDRAQPGRGQSEGVYDTLDDILRRRKRDLRSLPTSAEEQWLQ